MTSHFAALGMPVSTGEERIALYQQAAQNTLSISAYKGHYLKWAAPEGAELWLQMDQNNELIGAVPYFHGKSKMAISVQKCVKQSDDTHLEGALFAWAEPAQAEKGLYPLVFQAINIGCFEPIKLPFISELHLSAFAHHIEFHDSEAAFLAHQTQEQKIGPQSFIPSGLFHSDGSANPTPQAEAIFSGQILDHHLLTNPLTQREYHWLWVDIQGGSIDVLIDPQLISAPIKVGQTIMGHFWLCGLVLDPKL